MEWEITITDIEYEKCKGFAEKSSSSQREYRSGGTMMRNKNQIFFDTLRGKMGEIAIKKFLEQPPFNFKGIELDFKIYPRGVWDKEDFKISDKRFSIKTSKHFSRYLLLETKDLERGDTYDYYILVLVDEKKQTAQIAGYMPKNEMQTVSKKTLDLKKGECIPHTPVILDADNHARHKNDLLNSEDNWKSLVERKA
jgi:hypothetical protein